MHQALTQTVGLACRLWLTVFFLAHVAEYMAPGTVSGLTGFAGHGAGTGEVMLDMAMAGLFTVIALWLLLGIYSRITAMIGIVIFMASASLYHGSVLTPSGVSAMLAVAVLAITGGGRLRLYAGGWRVRDAL